MKTKNEIRNGEQAIEKEPARKRIKCLRVKVTSIYEFNDLDILEEFYSELVKVYDMGDVMDAHAFAEETDAASTVLQCLVEEPKEKRMKLKIVKLVE